MFMQQGVKATGSRFCCGAVEPHLGRTPGFVPACSSGHVIHCGSAHSRHSTRLQPLRAVQKDSKSTYKDTQSSPGRQSPPGGSNNGSPRHMLEKAERKVESKAKQAGRKTEEVAEENSNLGAKIAAPVTLLLGLGLILGGGYVFKDQLRSFIDYFIELAEQWGPLGYVAYGVVYTLLEILAVPAVPLTMTAGIIFGPVPGVIVVSGASTTAATLSFLIARYAARDRILELAEKNNKFRAVDKAIGKNGFKVVTLLRLSPLLPLALSNYFYGLTSVDLASYVAGSWLGMLPGTVLYVIAGDYGRELLGSEEGLSGGNLHVSKWQLGLGIAVTLGVLGYIGRLAKNALDEVEAEETA